MKRVGFKTTVKLINRDQRGEVNILVVSTIILTVLLVAVSAGFIWAFMQYDDWRSRGQEKIDQAVTKAQSEQAEADKKKFVEEFKKPYLAYKGPSDMGSVTFNYPKIWGGYTATAQGDTSKLNVYFSPYIVPKVDQKTPYSLRVSVVREPYDKIIARYNNLASKGKVKASTIVVGKTESFSGYEGVRVDGQLSKTIKGSVVVFKVRDKTLSLFVDSDTYMKDFNDIILKSLHFTP